MTWSLADRSLYLCTPIREDLESFVTSCVTGGVDVVQLRAKGQTDGEIYDAAVVLAARCGELGVPFLVNDRPDIALAVGADGVHVGQDDLSADVCRTILGDDAIVGLSTHADDDLDRALLTGATYLSAGPVTATPTKPGRPGTGTDYAARAVQRASVPVFVTGGVSDATIPQLAALGVRHFVVVRALTEALEPEAAARTLARSIAHALGEAART